jgi:DNA-binding MarR family transcriptional regulator
LDKINVAELFSEVVRFETELWAAVDKRLIEVHNLPLSRFEPMQVIIRTPMCRVSDIAEALSITVGGTSKLIDRIEAAGLCQRRVDPDDGRSPMIELTSAGKQLLAEATATFVSELEIRIGSKVSQRALKQFAATIRELRQGLREQDRNGEAESGNHSISMAVNTSRKIR